MRSKIYLHLNSFGMPYDLVRLSINDSLNLLYVKVTTFQRNNERAPVYELPPIHTLATTVQKNISNMNVQSSPGFDPFSTSFIKHAEKTIQNDHGKRRNENVLLRFPSYWLVPSVPVRRCHFTSLEQSQNYAFAQKRSNYVPQKLAFSGYQWLYL